MACHNHRCWLLRPTKLHISSTSASSTCRRMTFTCGGSRVRSSLAFTCLTAGAFFLSTLITVAELTLRLMVKKLMRLHARSISGAPQAVHDTGLDLDALCLG